jgi:hypothetical protein
LHGNEIEVDMSESAPSKGSGELGAIASSVGFDLEPSGEPERHPKASAPKTAYDRSAHPTILQSKIIRRESMTANSDDANGTSCC